MFCLGDEEDASDPEGLRAAAVGDDFIKQEEISQEGARKLTLRVTHLRRTLRGKG